VGVGVACCAGQDARVYADEEEGEVAGDCVAEEGPGC